MKIALLHADLATNEAAETTRGEEAVMTKWVGVIALLVLGLLLVACGGDAAVIVVVQGADDVL